MQTAIIIIVPMSHNTSRFMDRIAFTYSPKYTTIRSNVGKLDVPMRVLTPEEFAEEERKRRKRAWNRTCKRRNAEKERITKEKGV